MWLSKSFEDCSRYALPGREKVFLENTIGVFASKKFRKEIDQEFGPYSETVMNINHETFESDPKTFYESLCILNSLKLSNKQKEIVDKVVNNNECISTWYSPPLHWVVYATGKLENDDGDKGYASNLAIPERVGIHMYDMLIKLGAKEDATNYYKDSLRDIIQHYDTIYTMTRRTHNKDFLNHICNSLNM